MGIACQECIKYTMNYNGELKLSNLTDLLYADDVCLVVESAEPIQRVCDHVSTVIEEYGSKVSIISLRWSVYMV